VLMKDGICTLIDVKFVDLMCVNYIPDIAQLDLLPSMRANLFLLS
jgi:hypothetical protein